MTKELRHIDTGKHSLNKVSFDPSGSVLSVAGNSGLVQFVVDGVLNSTELRVSDDSCQSVLFGKTGECLIASGNGKTPT
jgi:sperm-associated antigen 16 protein